MTPIEHFLIDIIQILFSDWIENTITDIGRCKVATDIFLPTLHSFFYKRWPIIFFYGRGCFFVRCCRKNLQCTSARFFRWPQPKLWFHWHRHVLICSATKTLAHLGKKLDSPILIEKNASQRRRGKINDRGLKKKHHRMTPIKHFLLDIIQILFNDWIENTIANIGRCKAPTEIFQPPLRNFFYKHWSIIFFDGRGYFFDRCCRKNLQCRSARFFRSSSTEVVVRPTPACFHLFANENISPPRKKTWFADTDWKKC